MQYLGNVDKKCSPLKSYNTFAEKEKDIRSKY